MKDWFWPYRYIDTDQRDRAPFGDLADLARDIHRWRKAEGCTRTRCVTVGDPWDNGDGEGGEHRVALVQVSILKPDGQGGFTVHAARTCLTAGEDHDELRAALVVLRDTRDDPRRALLETAA